MSNNIGKTVLVTGGAGYIGSHCVVTLQQAGYDVIALDNFANSVDDGCDGSIALKRVEKITGTPVQFYKCDLLDTTHLEKIFQSVSVADGFSIFKSPTFSISKVIFLLVVVFNFSHSPIFCSCYSTKSIRSSILPQ